VSHNAVAAVALALSCCAGSAWADAILIDDFRSVTAGVTVTDDGGFLGDNITFGPPPFGGAFDEEVMLTLTSINELAEGTGTASQVSSFTPVGGMFSSFHAVGEATASTMAVVGAGTPSASVNSQAPISLDFDLEEPHFFDVEVFLANEGDTPSQSNATLFDDQTFEVFFDFVASTGQSGNFMASGLLPSGKYQLVVDAEVASFSEGGYTQSGSSSYDFLLELTPVPSPTTLCVFAVTGLLAARRRR